MSMGDADAKFPGQYTGIPPSPTRENPGQVYPKSDPNPASKAPTSGGDTSTGTVVGNPFLFQAAIERIDLALEKMIFILQQEGRTEGRSEKEEALVRKFKGWRDELGEMTHNPPVQSPTVDDVNEGSGGLFVD